MIALCSCHHPLVDKGAYTVEQLHQFKQSAAERSSAVEGRFEWMRNRLLTVVGGNFYYETPIAVQYRDQPMIWLKRDEHEYLLLNLRMLSTTDEERLSLVDNFWITKGNPIDFECPQSGALIHAEYKNSDKVRIEYHELKSMSDVTKRYPDAFSEAWRIKLPITAVEIHCKVGGTEVEFGPRWSRLPGNNIMRNCFIGNCSVGFRFS